MKLYQLLGLNPYSNGMRIEQIYFQKNQLMKSLNPYSYGIRIEHFFTGILRTYEVGLNPYSNGIRIEKNMKKIANEVFLS